MRSSRILILISLVGLVTACGPTGTSRGTGTGTNSTDKTDSTDSTAATDGTDSTDDTSATDSTSTTDGTEVVTPTDTTDATDNTDFTDPTDDTDPTDFTDPTDNTDPTDFTDPTDDTDPTDFTDPTDTTDPPEGSTCRQGFLCAVNCPQGDQGCLAGCLADVPPAGQQAFNDYVGCQQNTCATAPDTFMCIVTQCWDEFHGCIIGGEGPGSCPDITPCAQGCPPNDTDCTFDCYASVPKAESKKQLLIEACLSAECPTPPGGSPDQQCINAAAEGACAGEVAACQGAGKPGVLMAIPVWTILDWLEVVFLPLP